MNALHRFALATTVASCCVFGTLQSASATTQAGTAITNTSTASYSDGSTTYASQSNTVTTTVQNVPALTISPPSGSPGNNTVSPGATMTDTYTLTNTGNGSGYFQLTGTQSTDDGVTSANATFTSYIVNVPGQLQQTYSSIAAVNTYLSTGNTGSTPFLIADTAGTITIGVLYTAASNATGTITTDLTAAITQPAGSGTTQATSTSAVGNYSDTVIADSRMDVSVTAATPGATTTTYTVNYNNGGGRPMVAVNRNGLPAGAGITGNGIVVSNALPQFPVATTLALSGTPSFVAGHQPTGSTFIYSTNGTTWTTSTTGATYVGVFIPAAAITGSFGASNPGSSQNSVTAAQAQLAFTFTVLNSAANGAGNPTAVTDVANSIFADQSGYIEGPGIAFQTVANTGSATASQTAAAITNANGGLQGAGSTQSAAAVISNSVLNGPSGQPGAVGTDNNSDFTTISYTNAGTLTSSVTASTVSVPAAGAAITFTNSAQNTGNKDDIYTLTSTISTLPSGWTVQFQNMGSTPITTLAVTSGSTVSYKVVLTPPAGAATTFNAVTLYDDPIIATSGNDNTKSNTTHDDFFVGGFIKLVKTVDDAAGQTCASASTWTTNATTAKPNDCLRYTLTYTNMSPAGGTGNVALSSNTLVFTENGTASGGSGGTAYVNNWSTYSNGLYATPIDAGGTLGGYSAGVAVGSTRFTDSVASLAAGASGTVVYLVQVK